MQTKIMNEGWATYWHSRLMTEKVCDCVRDHRLRRPLRGRAGHLAGQLNPYKLGVELYRHVEERWNKGSSARSGTSATTWPRAATGTCRAEPRARRRSSRCARSTTTSRSSTSSSREDFVAAQKLFTFGYNDKRDRCEIETRKFKEVKEKLLFQLTNAGQPVHLRR